MSHQPPSHQTHVRCPALVSSYAAATRCPVLTSCIFLRVPAYTYSLPSAVLFAGEESCCMYPPTHPTTLLWPTRPSLLVQIPSFLCARYTISGTVLASYHATLVWYPVPGTQERMGHGAMKDTVLRGIFVRDMLRCGAELGYGGTSPCYGKCSTDVGYGAAECM
eukprot:684427-Rhodomonas_salina.5